MARRVMAARGVMDLGTADDGSLQAAAIGGDGQAFAALYDRHEQRVYGFCLRVLGSSDDAADATQETFVRMLQRLPALDGRELNFVAYVLTTARHACYDMIASRRTLEPMAEAPEPSGSAPRSLEEDPERAALLAATREEVEVAVAALPARQREVLALREVECLSYDEIAEIMEIRANAVAQLISRARIKLRELVRGGALASIEATSADCDRALPLIAMRQDGEHSSELDWLRSHLTACATCRARQAAMQEAGLSYRLLVPVVPLIWLRHAAIARAAEYLRVDWSKVASAGAGGGTGAAAGAGGEAAGRAEHTDTMSRDGAGQRHAAPGRPRQLLRVRGREAALAMAAFIAVLLLLTGSLSDRMLTGSAPVSSTVTAPPKQFAAPVQIRGRPLVRRVRPRRGIRKAPARLLGGVSGAPTGSGARQSSRVVVSQPSTNSPDAAGTSGTTKHGSSATPHAPGNGHVGLPGSNSDVSADGTSSRGSGGSTGSRSTVTSEPSSTVTTAPTRGATTTPSPVGTTTTPSPVATTTTPSSVGTTTTPPPVGTTTTPSPVGTTTTPSPVGTTTTPSPVGTTPACITAIACR